MATAGPAKKQTCLICTMDEDLPEILGEMMSYNKYSVHYYCLLLSTNLKQRGKNDTSGILGFFIKDIREEASFASKRNCKYCEKPGASVKCEECDIYYHNYCGYKNNCSSNFFDQYISYCHEHVTQEDNAPLDVTELFRCGICLEPMEGAYNPVSWITTKCCRQSYVHLLCMRKAALAAGYYFKCLFCSETEFREEIKSQNVFVPDQEALSEQEELFSDLYKKVERCGHKTCICPNGRNFNDKSGIWMIVCCSVCAIKGFHKGCMAKPRNQFTCQICKHVDEGNASLNDSDLISYMSLISLKETTKETSMKPAVIDEPTRVEINAVMEDYRNYDFKGSTYKGHDPNVMSQEEHKRLVYQKLRTLAILKRSLD